MQPNDTQTISVATETPTRKLPPLATSSDMPKEYADRPKLKLLWLNGKGLLDGQRQRFLEKAITDGKFKLDNEDLVRIQSLIPNDPLGLGPTTHFPLPKEVDPVMQGIRNTVVGLAAMGGSIVGISAGPGGVIAGGALGAAGGSSFIDNVENAVNFVGTKIFDKIYPDTKTTPLEGDQPVFHNVRDITNRALTEGVIDGMTSSMGQYAPYIGRALKQRILGITPQSVAIKEAGKRIGIDVLPVQVGAPRLQTFSAVFGRMPWIGGPFKQAAGKQTAKINNFIDTLPGRVSPRVLSDSDIGVKLDIAAQDAFTKTMGVLATKQEKLNTAARKLGAFISTDEVSATAKSWLDRYSNMSINQIDKPTMGILQRVADLGKKGKIGIDQWDSDLVAGIRGELDRLQGGEGTKALTELLDSARVDLAGSGVPGLRQLAMDREWERGLSQFESIAAKKFQQLDRNRFKAGVLRLGSTQPDQLVDLLTAGKSPKTVYDVRGIVGDDVMKDLGARYIDKNVKKSIKIDKMGNDILDIDKLVENLGLADVKSGRYGVTKEMIRGTGVTVDMLHDFVDVARVAEKTEVPNVSTFLARRIVLAGAASTIAAMAGLGGPKGLIGSVALTLLARNGMKVLTNPENIRMATVALDANVEQAVRRTAVMRLYASVMRDRDYTAGQPQFTRAPLPGAAQQPQ